MYWFTADTHFDHSNIIKYCNRPFKNVEEMNKILIRNWNQRVKEEDTVFIVGDFCFKETMHKAEYFVNQLKGKKIFIKGNHDSHNGINTKIISLVLRFGKRKHREILLVHNPLEGGIGYYLILSGHVHNKWKFKRYEFPEGYYDCCNVGVDVWNYYPISINEIFKEYHKWLRKLEMKT